MTASFNWANCTSELCNKSFAISVFTSIQITKHLDYGVSTGGKLSAFIYFKKTTDVDITAGGKSLTLF